MFTRVTAFTHTLLRARLTDLTKAGWVVLLIALVAVVQVGGVIGPWVVSALPSELAPNARRLLTITLALPLAALCAGGFVTAAFACRRFGAPVLTPCRIRSEQREP